jgi:hypothetical protein
MEVPTPTRSPRQVPRPCPYPRSSRPWRATSTSRLRPSTSSRTARSSPWPRSAIRGPDAGCGTDSPRSWASRCARCWPGRAPTRRSPSGPPTCPRRCGCGSGWGAAGHRRSRRSGDVCNAWTTTSLTGWSAPAGRPRQSHRPARADAGGRGRRQERPRRAHR